MRSSMRSSSVVIDTSRSPCARLRPVPVGAVELSDSFWEPRRRVNREITLPSQCRRLEKSGVLDNFRRAAGKVDVPFRGKYFADSDLYKWLEGVAWTLAADPDSGLERMASEAIAEIAEAQEPDGYLDTYYTFEKSSERWTELPITHELYCAGHLIQAAVAHHRATGGTSLLDIAIKLADHICEVFGPEEEGKRPGTDGHEEIEMALIELARETGSARYLRQARFFTDIRGYGLLGGRDYHGDHGLAGGREYHQDHRPLREMEEMVGHAVRAVYLTSGATDLYAETGDPALMEALERLWRNMTTRRMYITGGIGSRYEDEAFGEDYELPNSRAYTETCAAIGSVMWNWRMLAVDGGARYADLMEHTLYNAVLPGLSLDGLCYFYQNPLADDGGHRRQPWFGVACCPPNIARLLASLPGYFYSVSENRIWTHLYAASTADIKLDGESPVRIRQHTRYPWDGEITVEVRGTGHFGLMLRVPGWCGEGVRIEVNGRPFDGRAAPGSYAEIRRAWRPGDLVRLVLPMPVRRLACHPYVPENAGRIALMRGPLLYCVERADNSDMDLRDIVLPGGEEISADFRPELLGGVVALSVPAEIVRPGETWNGVLYRTVASANPDPRGDTAEVTAIPYYAWANREAGAMQVWLRER